MLQGRSSLDFVFRFEMLLLLQAAGMIFTQEYIDQNPVHEDLACEIANIVCAKVKTYLDRLFTYMFRMAEFQLF